MWVWSSWVSKQLLTLLDLQRHDNHAIEEALLKKNVPSDIRNWYIKYIKSRTATLSLNDNELTIDVRLGTPQGGVMSPKVGWNAAYDDLLEIMNEGPTKGWGFADDGNFLAIGDDIKLVQGALQRTLNATLDWAGRTGLVISAEKKGLKSLQLTLGEQEIEQVTQTPYLGVILDHNLSWGPHIDSKTKAAKRNMAMIRSVARRTWGPAPKIMKWIYTAVPRPSMTYGAMTWVKALERSCNVNKLNHVQRLALLNIANVRQGTPTLGMEVLYNIMPLPLWIKMQATKSFWRVQPPLTWLPEKKSLIKIGHIHYLNRINPVPLAKIDNIEPTRVWTKFYDAYLNTIEEGEIPSNAIRIYTDGSQINNATGLGVVIYDGGVPLIAISEHIGDADSHTVYQAEEVLAIWRAMKFLQDEKVSGRDIVVQIDNQSAIQSLGNPYSDKEIVCKTKEILNEVSCQNTVKLHWIKAHKGHIGNEEADLAAKAGAQSKRLTTLEAKPALARIKQKITVHFHREWDHQWRYPTKNQATCRHTKVFFPNVDSKKANHLMGLSRPKLSLAVRMITGHCFLQKQA